MSKNICQIIGYFNSGSNSFGMKRTIMKNSNNQNYNFYLFIQNNMRNIYQKNYLNNDKNVYFFKNNNELEILLLRNSIDYIVLSIDFEHWYNCIKNFDQNKIYYVGHGIIPHYFNEELLTPIYKNWINTKINLCICCKKQYEIISKYKNNVYKIGTLPQFENLIVNKKYNIKDNILIVGGNSIIARQSSISDLLLNECLFSIYSNFHSKEIILKLPRGKKTFTTNNKINNNNKLKILSDNDFLYNFYDSNLIIIFEGGTAYLEALLTNSKVILILYSIDTNNVIIDKNINNFFISEVKEFSNFPSEKYPNLLVAKNKEMLDSCFELINKNPNYFNSNEYINDKEQFIKDSIGEYIPDINNQLIDIIEKK